MKIKLIVIALLFLCLSLSAISLDELQKKIDGSYRDVSSWQAKIKQTNYFSQIKQSIVFEGNLYYQSKRLLISFNKPSVQRLLIDNGRVQLYDAQSKTLIKSSLLPEFERMNPLEILQHYWTKSKVRIDKQDKNQIHISMIPEKDSFIKSLRAVVESSNGRVIELSYSDFSDNTVTYNFSNIKINARIDDSIWQMKYPKDTQIIQR